MKNNFSLRILRAIIGFGVGMGLAYMIPHVYYKYVDNRQYIEYVGNVTLDKKEYEPCETQVAQSTFKILIDAPIEIESRLYLQKESKNTNEVIKEYRFSTFLKAEPEPQVHISRASLPCGLEPGIYFYRGILIYHIKGVERVSPFASEQFTIR